LLDEVGMSQTCQEATSETRRGISQILATALTLMAE
jgi:hypothetical protein